MVRTLREGTRRECWQEWERVRCPTLLVRAGSGFFTKDHLEAMAARLPGARFVDIPDAMHDVHLDRPEQWRARDFGGPYDVVFANAVLVHLTDAQLDLVLAKAFLAVRPGGLLAFTVKEGDGEAWSTAKVGRPRFFNYWREPSLLEHILATGWRPLSVKHAQGRTEPWINAICARP
jgi:predicted TPR repeat methyltransferase